MQLQRLWHTLTFFEVIPFFSCVQKFFSPKQSYKSSMNQILLFNDHSDLAKKIIQSLAKSSRDVCIITSKPEQITPSVHRQVIPIESKQETLSPTILEAIDNIICFPQVEINPLINLVNQQLNPGEMILCYFTEQNQQLKNLWGAVDDVVMGGVSNSNLRLQPRNAIFTGIVSTDNNGGFVSVRTKNFNPPWNLSAYEGIRLRVKGDGQRYKFITRCEGKWDGISYCYSFNTISDIWLTVDIPFSQLIPVFRAKTVSEAGKFDSAKVYSLQLMLSKFEYDGAYNPTFRAGAFQLAIESIKAYGQENSPQLILMGDLEAWNNQKIETQLLKVYARELEDLDL